MGRNGDLVREGFKLVNQGKINEVLDLYDNKASIEFAGSILGGAYKGKQAIGQFYQKVGETYPGGLRLQVKNVLETGNAVVVESIAKGKLANGNEINSRDVHVFELSRGKVVKHRGYIDEEQLARAAGRL